MRIFILICMLSFAGMAQAEGQNLFFKKVKYTREGLRDPFLSPFDIKKEEPRKVEVKKKVEKPSYTKLPTLNIEGMIWGSERPQAIIDGEVFEVGDTVKGAKIIEITKEGVAFVLGGRKFILKPTLKKRMR